MAPLSTLNESGLALAFQPVRSLPLKRLTKPDSTVRAGGAGIGTGVYLTYVTVRTGVIDPSGSELLISSVSASPLSEYACLAEPGPPRPPVTADITTSLAPSHWARDVTVAAPAPPWLPPTCVRLSSPVSFSVTDSGLLSGVRIVTLSAACVIVSSNGFTCPLIAFSGRHVPDRFGGACAARAITITLVASIAINIARFMYSSFGADMLHRVGNLAGTTRVPDLYLLRILRLNRLNRYGVFPAYR